MYGEKADQHHFEQPDWGGGVTQRLRPLLVLLLITGGRSGSGAINPCGIVRQDWSAPRPLPSATESRLTF
jgi:hypothetical protein